jgi:Domain of unknown function (DUF1707)
MSDRLRPSDADRDRAAALLREHFADGRLTPAELGDRLTLALGAATSGDLRRALAGLAEPTTALLQDGSLERGYRRLLAFYPAAYRRVHEEEMLAVLMTAAPQGKRRAGLAEAADLILGALRVRCQPSRGGMAGRRGALALITAGALLGLLAGSASAAANPPRWAVTATVRIQPDTPGEAYTSNPLIVERAAIRISPAISLQALQAQVQISRTSSRIVVISAPLTAGARAVAAVAQSYVAYVSGKDAPGGNGKLHPAVLYVESVAPRTSLFADVLGTGGLGALCGALIGAIGAAALSLPRRRLRTT